MIILALHGFLGEPEDWKRVLGKSKHRVFAPDLAIWATKPEGAHFTSMADAINRLLEKHRRDDIAGGGDGRVILAGYSLGARLAAHCLLARPKLYSAAILLSFNPGLPASDQTERQARVQSDSVWCERLRSDDWQKVWDDWNAQDVLKPGSRMAESKSGLVSRRHEGLRQAWAKAMHAWSLGLQNDLSEGLKNWAVGGKSLTIMSGAEDKKFTDLTVAWIDKSIRHRTVLGGGHRLLTEAPDDVAAEIEKLAAAK